MNSEKRKPKRIRKAPNRKWQQNEEWTLVDFLRRNIKNFEKKIRRIRKAPIRKWQKNEEWTLVDFLKRNIENFEKPTAQIFYKQFTDETHIDIDWPLIRAKVRNMRMSYARAKQWSESSDANANLNSGESIRDVTLKMFRYYDVFEELFGTNEMGESSLTLNRTEYVKEENLSDGYQTSYTGEEMFPENEASSTFLNEESNEDSKLINEADTNSVDTISKNQTGCSFDNRPEIEEEEERSKRPRLDSDQLLSLKEEELQFQREKLEFEREKLKQEMAIKRKEIESQEKLKILELEMKERIALTEIKMKERVALQALDKKWQ